MDNIIHGLPLVCVHRSFVSVDEVVALLAQAGLFELALDMASRFKLSTVPVFEALTARSVN